MTAGTPPAADEPRERPGDAVAAVTARADAGDLEGARAVCRGRLLVDPTNAKLRFYDGVIARALGLIEEAESAFRKALYLDRAFVMAHYHLGLFLIERGRRNLGRRSVANAATLASTLPDDTELPEGDGITAAILRDNARLVLAQTAELLSAEASS